MRKYTLIFFEILLSVYPADVLYKLSSLYNIDLTDLLIASGKIKADPNYKSPGPFSTKKPELQKLTPKEEKELIQYLHFLRYKKN